MSDHISRRLSHDDARGAKSIVGEDALLAGRAPIVLLGEPGMGKTELMLKLNEHPGYQYITARSLVRRQPAQLNLEKNDVLAIDALDEIAAFGEEDTVHQVLASLSALGYPRFIISCRAAEWRGALPTLRGLARTPTSIGTKGMK